MLPGGEGERRVVERGAEEGRCWADSKVHPYWCLVAAGGPGQSGSQNKLGMTLCVSMCACFQLGGGEGERRERGAEEGGRCWAFRVLPSLWC